MNTLWEYFYQHSIVFIGACYRGTENESCIICIPAISADSKCIVLSLYEYSAGEKRECRVTII